MSPQAGLRREIGPVSWLILDRPEQRNALDQALIDALGEALLDLAHDPAVRAVIVTGNGPAFSAGADITAMRGDADERSYERALVGLLCLLDELPKPTVAMVNGPAMGAGAGLVAACDVAVASTAASFSVGGVRLGLVPAVVAPVIVRALGARQARRYLLTGERFGAERACELGLVHEVVAPEVLEGRTREVTGELLRGAPEALAETKRALQLTLSMPQGGSLLAEGLVGLSTAARVSAEGREGMAAFGERREPGWILPEASQARSQTTPSNISLAPKSSSRA